MMKVKDIFLFLLIAVLTLSFIHCSSALKQNQLQFGIMAAKNDLWDEAIFRWKKVILSNPQSASAHNNLAVAYEKKGLQGEAEKEYEIAIKLSPSNKYIQSNYQKFKKTNENKKNIHNKTE